MLSLVGLAFDGIVDSVYREIAHGDPEFGFVLLMFVIAFMLAVSSHMLRVSLRWSRKGQSKEKKYRKTEEQLLRRMRWLAWTNFVLSFALGLWIIATGHVHVKSIKSFKQHLAVLAPNLSEAEYKELVARFASMEGKDDYDAISRDLHESADRFDIKLPENKLYAAIHTNNPTAPTRHAASVD